jgi:hypothetical protein
MISPAFKTVNLLNFVITDIILFVILNADIAGVTDAVRHSGGCGGCLCPVRAFRTLRGGLSSHLSIAENTIQARRLTKIRQEIC